MDTGVQKYRAFVAAADAGSIAQAAEELGYAVSSISRMIADLEAATGVRLFVRSKAGVALTSDGRRLLASARAIVADCDEFAQKAASITGLEIGTVRIGLIASIATHVLPPVLKRFREQHPGIKQELLLGDYVEIEEWLAEGHVDMGTVRLPASASFETFVLMEDQHVAVLPRGHKLASRKKFPLSAFANEPFLTLERDGVSEVGDLLKRNGVNVEPALTTWDDYAIMAMVEAGLGLAILPSIMMKRCAYDVVAIPLNVPSTRTVAMAWNKRRTLPAAAQAFLDALRQ